MGFGEAVISGLSSLLGGIGTGIFNTASTSRTNETNKEIAAANNAAQLRMFNEQMDYTKSVQQREWDRADTAYTRAVADAKSAGLSPLVTAGSGGSSSGAVVSQPSAPTLESPRMEAPQLNDPNMVGQAVEAYMMQRRLDQEDKRIILEEKKLSTDKEQREADREFQREKLSRELENANKLLDVRIKAERSENKRKLAQDMKQFNASIELQTRAQSFDERIESQRYVLEAVKSLVEEASGRTGGQSSAYKVYYDKSEYETAYAVWTREYSSFIESWLQTPTRSSFARNISESGGNNFLGNASQGSGYSESSDYSVRDQNRIIQWFNDHPVPLYRARD